MDRDLRLALMAGVDIPIPELSLTAHPPQIKEIALMGEKEFFSAAQYLCIDKESLVQDKSISMALTNFQVLMKVLEQSQDKHKKTTIQTLLLLLFPEYQSVFLPNGIILNGQDLPVVTIDDSNFDIFQDYLKAILCVNNVFQGDNIVYKPANEAAQRIADKIMAGRKKIAQLKGGEGNSSLLTRYLSILTVGIHSMSLNDVANLTLFQMFDLVERYTAFVEWDIDLRLRLAGGKPDKTVESWMKDLHP